MLAATIVRRCTVIVTQNLADFPTKVWSRRHRRATPRRPFGQSPRAKAVLSPTLSIGRAVVRDDERLDHSTIRHWLQGSKAPRSVASMEVLGRIERRYRLPAGYFKAKLPHQTRSASGYVLDDIAPAERRRLAWHLPDDFNIRPRQEQEEILEWVRRVIIRVRPTTGASRQPR